MVVKVRDDNDFEEIPLISILSSSLPIPLGPRWNETFWKPVISQNRDTGKGPTSNKDMFYDIAIHGSSP